MASDSIISNSPFNFTPSTRTEFLSYLEENSNKRRISQLDRQGLIEWLCNSHAPPSSQKEFSRRNYVRKNFTWDESGQALVAVAKKSKKKDRKVVTEDEIFDVVERVHASNGHAGWDATWRDISDSYYGILRADVIFLLKRCEVCAQNPRKRPKGSGRTGPEHSRVTDPSAPNFGIDDLFFDHWPPFSPQDRDRDGWKPQGSAIEN
ncbi:hypothetical protein N658DRAFT_502360 [Parathielavia hyrcaniae]|uniref:Integrase zinc-binding domain-containing protein n=1 Tax=Parathielavia hyrcaniae TaxID=113614 RepID=A0AAN6SWM9_9PEZI|nr:hypothetical protein N658DRAFT_502426 [Parathielavia hyrcaniae]KAK4095756.1 hypothetical protein N658DRAFT_502360 [Parathielavia hyrcaniae]